MSIRTKIVGEHIHVQIDGKALKLTDEQARSLRDALNRRLRPPSERTLVRMIWKEFQENKKNVRIGRNPIGDVILTRVDPRTKRVDAIAIDDFLFLLPEKDKAAARKQFEGCLTP